MVSTHEPPRYSPVSGITDLRQRADLCRRVASVPTEGGRREDRVLLIIADRLEHDGAREGRGNCQEHPRINRLTPRLSLGNVRLLLRLFAVLPQIIPSLIKQWPRAAGTLNDAAGLDNPQPHFPIIPH